MACAQGLSNDFGELHAVTAQLRGLGRVLVAQADVDQFHGRNRKYGVYLRRGGSAVAGCLP